MPASEEQAKELSVLMTFHGLVRATVDFMRRNEQLHGYPLRRIDVAATHVISSLTPDGIQEVDIETGSRKAVAGLEPAYRRLRMSIVDRVAYAAEQQMGEELGELIDNRNSAWRLAHPENEL